MRSGLHILTMLTILTTSATYGQTMSSLVQSDKDADDAHTQLRWGVHANIGWSTFGGPNLARDYFVKPSLGLGLRAEYYFLQFLGVGAGLGYQQRGAGIINTDLSGGAYSHPLTVGANGVQGDPDSTHLEKIRLHCLEIPVSLLLRARKDIITGLRLSGSAGVAYVYTFEATDVVESISDGFHHDRSVTDQYLQHDLALQLSFGGEIHSQHNNLFQVHFLYTKGLGNVYASGQGTGSTIWYGIRLTFFL